MRDRRSRTSSVCLARGRAGRAFGPLVTRFSLLFLLVGSVTLHTACRKAAAPDEESAPAATSEVHAETWPQVSSPVPVDPELESRVEALLAKMSLEEKVGQVIQGESPHVTPDDLRAYHLGSVLNGGGTYPRRDRYAKISEWVAQADGYWDASTDTKDGGAGIPILWGIDAVHGHNNVIGATLFPHNVGLGAARDPELLRRIGQVTATEVLVTGLDWTFGPTVAVARDDRWGRAFESWSEDPEVVAAYAAAVVEGLQGRAGTEEFLGPSRLIATAKHFLADGGTEGGKDQGDSKASEEELRTVHAAGYVAALGAGVQTVMASFSGWQGVKLHGHQGLLTDVLKERMGFDGILVGDWNAHGQVPGCTNSSCPQTYAAGLDLVMVPEDWKAFYASTLEQARSGQIASDRLDDAVRRMLRVKLRAGLFEKGRPSSRPFAGKTEVLGSAEHRAVARQAVRQSLVLLKNDGGLLPLRPNQRVLVAGDGADNVGKQCGGWTITWQGTETSRKDFPGATSIWDGIRAAVSAAGGTATLSPDGSFAASGPKPDVAIVVWGENPYAEFQGDLATLEYQPGSKRDLALLRKLRDAGVPVVSVMLSGRPLWVNPELNASDAFVAAWLPGSEGNGIAEVLFRAADGSVAHDFSGKLSFSWPKRPDQAVLHRGQESYDPLFPFGFGLTYADRADLPELSEEGAAPQATGGAAAFFDGDALAPWELFVGDAANWRVAAAETGSTTGPHPLQIQPADRTRQGDARAVRWAGGATAQVYLQGPPVDISRESNGDLALAFDVLVEQPPSSPVTLRMDCAHPCSGALDVTERLRELPAGEWQTLRFRLRCFAEAGADMTRIDTPFLLATDGTLALRFADVKLVSAGAGPADCP